MKTAAVPKSIPRYLLHIAAGAAAYYLTGRVGLSLADAHANVTLI
ncbi:MAG: hypothetical protein O2923_04005 [Verrucomicrobia bacterium]|nr:hypothetical protein [Verrucomicrobiota bacterium]MDA1086359.1 hypothetical protein [Verrucomicrobiota bacterium]